MLSGRLPYSDHRDFHAVDGREGVEETAPLLAAVVADPESSGGGAEVERGRLQVVDVHRIALNREETLLLWQAAGEPLPRVTAVLAAPHCGRAPWTGARRRLEWHDVDRFGVVGVDDDGE